jgi:hypothetical protein
MSVCKKTIGDLEEKSEPFICVLLQRKTFSLILPEQILIFFSKSMVLYEKPD